MLNWEIIRTGLFSEGCHFLLGGLVVLVAYYLVSNIRAALSSDGSTRPDGTTLAGWLFLALALGILSHLIADRVQPWF